MTSAEANAVKVGDSIGFKCDVEQYAEVVQINTTTYGLTFTVKAPPDGFSGSYVARSDFVDVRADDAWID